MDDTQYHINSTNNVKVKIQCPEELKTYIPKSIQEYKEILEEYSRLKKFVESDPSSIVQYPVLTLPKIQRDTRDI